MCRSNAWLVFAKKNKSNTWTMKSYVLKCVECISFLIQHSQNQSRLKKNLNCSLTTIMYASLQSSLLVPCYIYGTLPANKWNRLKPIAGMCLTLPVCSCAWKRTMKQSYIEHLCSAGCIEVVKHLFVIYFFPTVGLLPTFKKYNIAHL